MKVLCFNCHNSIKGNDFIEHSKTLANYIKENNYDIIGTQEMSGIYTRYLDKNLDEYNMSGGYRFCFGILNKLSLFERINENNKIIFKGTKLSGKTFRLPWFPFNKKELQRALRIKSLMRRIASGVLVETKSGDKFYVINTHLEYASASVQVKQLKKIYKFIKQKHEKYNIIFMGDLNMEITNPILKEFTEQLEELGIKRVPIFDKTNALKHGEKTAIDHIYIPGDYTITRYGTIEDPTILNITDHKPIYVEFEKEG